MPAQAGIQGRVTGCGTPGFSLSRERRIRKGCGALSNPTTTELARRGAGRANDPPGVDVALAAVVAPPEGLEIGDVAHPAQRPGQDVVDLPAVVALQRMLVELNPVAADVQA